MDASLDEGYPDNSRDAPDEEEETFPSGPEAFNRIHALLAKESA